ncbi:hypothetical protein HYU89_01380 [Candidatus Collierbacteria bacterium]|nr:hypothetical protein [Candidatus Collierbacteria bacterium]
MKRIFYLSICLFVYLSILSASAYAAGITNPALADDLGRGDPANVFGRFVGSWWGLAYVIGGLLFLLYLVWGGVEWIMGGGNKDRIESAKNKISNGILGLTLLAASFALVKAIGFVLGIDLLETLTFDLSRLAP